MELALIPERGPLAVSVPGAVDGWCELHARFGRLPLRDLLAPSIDYAREGFPVTEVIGAVVGGRCAVRCKAIPASPRSSCRTAARRRSASRSRIPALARAYELIANEGRAAFYDGPIAAAIEQCVRGNGGYLGREDLAAHRSRVGRARVDDVSRLERLRAAAERSGHRRAADAEHPRGLRSRARSSGVAPSTCIC